MFKTLSTTLFLSVTATFSSFAAGGGQFYPTHSSYPVFDVGSVKCPDGYDRRSVCRRLAEPFGYLINDLGFEAAPGLITDGASIPFWAQGLIGKPHTQAYSRAATLHDHYVLDENAVYSYLVVQRMFYDALVDSGVPQGDAKIMYAAVLVGASKWSLFYRAVPEKCDQDIPNCIRSPLETDPDDVLALTPQSFSHPRFEQMLSSITDRADFDELTLNDLETLALSTRLFEGIATPPPVVFGDGETK